MFQKKKGIDIIVHIGGITTFEEANRFFENRLDEKNLSRIQQIKNPEIAVKIANSIPSILISKMNREGLSIVLIISPMKGKISVLLQTKWTGQKH